MRTSIILLVASPSCCRFILTHSPCTETAGASDARAPAPTAERSAHRSSAAGPRAGQSTLRSLRGIRVRFPDPNVRTAGTFEDAPSVSCRRRPATSLRSRGAPSERAPEHRRPRPAGFRRQAARGLRARGDSRAELLLPRHLPAREGRAGGERRRVQATSGAQHITARAQRAGGRPTALDGAERGLVDGQVPGSDVGGRSACEARRRTSDMMRNTVERREAFGVDLAALRDGDRAGCTVGDGSAHVGRRFRCALRRRTSR